ncbi:LysR family transcriptional regulator [Methylomonas methanica]|uniref:LysR family transcriptional regulator n=1 Tax=Methylomonas methanica TaxID=421 RepID=A0A177MT95_METMH|nr:LysR family transcriptional regulator [Methylomonas methanica]OAI08998.1 LysR family transcriptional regulator [Methylomonas methanica]
MASLNYHHLRYFWMIANENNLTRAAERLHVSQSALSIQLRQLEESFGQKLFEREGKRLQLTEAGRITLDYANAIFRAGDELISLMHGRSAAERQLLRIGAVSTLSRNFQLELVRSLVQRSDVELVLHSGSLRELLAQMHTHTIDLVLSNRPVPRDAQTNWHCHLLDEQPVSLVGKPDADNQPFQFPQDLDGRPLLLPSIESEIRAAFDFLLEQAGVRPLVVAEVDDMAMLRLLARESGHLTLVPPVVVLDELRQGLLVERYRITDIRERFYAITPSRRFPNALVKDLLAKSPEAKVSDNDPASTTGDKA